MTPTFFLLGVVFLLSSPTLTAAVSIDLTLHITCNEGYSNWCADVYVVEEDPISPDDFVAARNECIFEGNATSVMDMVFGVIPLDGDTSPNYEIMPYISHNCSKDGTWYCWKPNSPYDVSTRRPETLDLKINLSEDRDQKGKCRH